MATSATTGGAGSPRAPLIRTRSNPSCASRTESSRNTTSGAAYRAPATPSRSWSVTVPTVTDPNADGWRVTTPGPADAISAIGYPPVTRPAVRVTADEESPTPAAPGPPARTCPTPPAPATAPRAHPARPRGRARARGPRAAQWLPPPPGARERPRDQWRHARRPWPRPDPRPGRPPVHGARRPAGRGRARRHW